MRSLSDFAQKARDLSGWRRNLTLFLVGAACVFLFAPFNAFPLLFLLLPAFFLILDASPSRPRAAWDGFFFGYGYFMAGTYWIAISLTVDAAKFGWMIPLSIFGLSAAFALYFMLFGYLYHRLKFAGLFSNLLWFSVLWVLIEYLRSIGTFGFAWNLIGYSLVPISPLLQSASVVGAFGLSLLTLILSLAVVPYLAKGSAFPKRFALIAKGALALGLFYGILHQAPASIASGPKLRVVQANIEQRLKWDSNALGRILYTQRILSNLETESGTPDIVIWPETAIPMLLSPESDWLQSTTELVPKNASLISGVVQEEGADIHNAVAIFQQGAVTASYNKRQLVPFGEFIPLRSVLPLDKIAPGPRDFSPGTKASSVEAANVPAFKPLICYESIFPWLAHSDSSRARWLLTVTNDAWFGNSPGPYQHLAMGRVRAVEQGLPLVRAANTGISAVVDANGHILRSLRLNEQGVIDMRLPAALPATIYSRFGEGLVLLSLLTIYLLAMRYRDTT